MGVVTRLFPIARWLPRYKRDNLRYDLIAGVTVAALVVPKALGYAGIASVPLQSGLYAAAAAAVIYSLFGTSRQISTGPSSALAAVAGSAVAVTSVGDDAPELVAAITITAGLLFLLMAVFKMGWISQFLSKPVITGFLFGAAIEVVIGELPKITGTDAEGKNSWQKFDSWIEGLEATDGTTIAVGLVSLVVIVGLRFAAPKVPGALVLVVGGLVASALLDLGDRGVTTVGDVPSGLPSPALPSWELITNNFQTIATSALALVLIGFSQTAGFARQFAARHQYRVDIDQESVAQGMVNVGAGVLQGMPVSTSLSASSLNDSAGARTQLASLVTGGSIVLVLLFLAPLFSDLPKAVLAALIIDAVVFGMMNVAEMRRMWQIKRFDFWIAVAAILAVLSAGVLAGVLIGMALSLGWLVYVSTSPASPELGWQRRTEVFQSLDDYPNGERFPGLLVLRFDAGLFFATADPLEDRLREATVDPAEPISGVILDFAGVDFIDSQGSAKMDEILTLAEQSKVSFRLASVKPHVLSVLGADGFLDRLGEDHVHGNVKRAVEAELGDTLTL